MKYVVNKKKRMTKRNPNIEILKKVLDIISEKEDIPKKFSMKFITENIKKINKEEKETKEEKKKEKKLTPYNMFVKEQMPKIKKEYPKLTNNERMSHIGKMWKEQKNKK